MDGFASRSLANKYSLAKIYPLHGPRGTRLAQAAVLTKVHLLSPSFLKGECR